MASDRMLTLTVDAEHSGSRTDVYLGSTTDLSRSAAAGLCDKGAVSVNGKPAGKKLLLTLGDTVTVTLPEPAPTETVAQDIPLDIVYEDEYLLVVNKPVGMVVHPAPGHEDGTLVNALLHHCGDSLSGIGGEKRPGIVHRIDRDTGGLLVVAKDDITHRTLSAALEKHEIVRTYRALVCGGFHTEGGSVNAPIGRHPTDRKRMAVLTDPTAHCRHAVTHYSVVGRYGPYTDLELVLETGRTHQIRVHMSHIGHPLMGDTVYGGGRTEFEKQHSSLLCGQCLYAVELSFTHPRTGEQMHLCCALPEDYTRLLELLRKRYCE